MKTTMSKQNFWDAIKSGRITFQGIDLVKCDGKLCRVICSQTDVEVTLVEV